MLALYCITNRPKIDPLTREVIHPYLVALPKSQESLVDPVIRKEKEDGALKNPLIAPHVDPLELPLPNLIRKSPASKYRSDTQPKDKPRTDTKPAKEPKQEPDAKKAEDAPAKKTPTPPDSPKDAFLAIHEWPSVPKFVGKMLFGLGLGLKKDDNSNTQFAILALWASRNYRVPIELTLVRLDQRFRTSQLSDGAWSYQIELSSHLPGPKHKFHKGTPSMTCVGLLGLGIGHGAFQEAAILQNKNPTPPNFVYDPAIQKGLASLGKSVGKNMQGVSLNLYQLWSLERVAVLYNLPTIGGVDWFTWGADLIISRQQFNGSWAEKGYSGSSETIDTSMALLFLGRANLNRDLSESLRRYIVVIDPARVNNP